MVSRRSFVRIGSGGLASVLAAATALGVAKDAGASRAVITESCEWVELQPGYPGYRGLVTGISGPGESACLDDLEDADRDFSKSEEDRANRSAARRLGISGQSDEWTWESWMSIEADRGLSANCHACLYVEGVTPPRRSRSDVERDDPRLQLGYYQGTTVANSFIDSHDLAPNLTSQLGNDDQLRAGVSLLFPGQYLSAPKLLDQEFEFLRLITGLDGPPYSYVDPVGMYSTLIEQGGYVQPIDGLHPNDQLYLILGGMAFLRTYTNPPESMDQAAQRAIEECSAWQRDAGFNGGFGKWLRQQGAAHWIW
jgi:hypothetical protein